MLANVAAETEAALKADRTLRCLAKIKYDKESRRSPDVIAWGEAVARKFCRSLLRATGLEMEHEMLMHMVGMSVRKKVLLCFDIFLSDCSADTKTRIQQSINEPIHFLFVKNKTFYIRRHRGLDEKVSSDYEHTQGWDKGPLPYFTDYYNPPIYCEGKRMEHGVTYFGEPIKLYRPGDSDKEEDDEHGAAEDADEPEEDSRENVVGSSGGSRGGSGGDASPTGDDLESGDGPAVPSS